MRSLAAERDHRLRAKCCHHIRCYRCWVGQEQGQPKGQEGFIRRSRSRLSLNSLVFILCRGVFWSSHVSKRWSLFLKWLSRLPTCVCLWPHLWVPASLYLLFAVLWPLAITSPEAALPLPFPCPPCVYSYSSLSPSALLPVLSLWENMLASHSIAMPLGRRFEPLKFIICRIWVADTFQGVF